MSDDTKKPPATLDVSLAEAMARFIQTDPGEASEALATDVQKGQARAKRHIKAARQEIEDGGRPRKGRFRL
ncbi:MAG TPA: hypothetical protein VF474_13945 [Phenylobacterium sp.]